MGEVDELWVSPVKRTLMTMAPVVAAIAKSKKGVKAKVKSACFENGGMYSIPVSFVDVADPEQK